jgi:chromosome segregation ATPase
VATREEQLATLAAADEHLTSILAEMASLHNELGRLRGEGTELLRVLSEYESTAAERDVAMFALEEECATLRLQANAEGANLAESNALLEEQRRHVQALERDVETLRSRLIERDRRVAAVEAELASAQDELTRRQQSLVQEHSRVEAAESALMAADRRAEALSLRLESEAREREPL